jgi:CheY-like chemotaxis protein
MRVLVAEDDEVLATAVAAGLRREGMAVDITLDGSAALEHAAVNRYDVVVLDRDLPGVHGDDVCRALAAGRSGSRVLMLTAARSVKERVEGLELGADDYLPKPFDFAELSVISTAPNGGRLRHIRMTPRSWITAGWVSIAAAAGLAVGAIAQTLGAVNSTCVQPLVTGGLAHVTCPGAGAQFVRGLICAVLAGVAFFSGLACFFWAAHLRSTQQMRWIGQSQADARHRVFD